MNRDKPIQTGNLRAWMRSMLGLASLVLLVPGCGSDIGGPGTSSRASGGPLAALTQPGGQAIAPPPNRQLPASGTWSATFGFPVCTEGPDVTVEGVKIEGVQRGTSAAVRTVEAGPDWSLPLASALGSPPAWREPYADPDTTGSYTPAGDAVVDQPCAGDDSAAPSDRERYQELLVTLRAEPEGQAISSFSVDYSAEGRAYVVDVPWEMVLCGTDSDPELCQ